MVELSFPKVEVKNNEYDISMFYEGQKIIADIGEVMTDIRKCEVVKVDEKDNKLNVKLPGIRLDGPYIIPVDNVYDVIDEIETEEESDDSQEQEEQVKNEDNEEDINDVEDEWEV